MSGLGISTFRLFCRKCNVYRAEKLSTSQNLLGNVPLCRNITGADVRDPTPLFFNAEVQKLLRKLNRIDMKKVFKHKKDGQKLDPPDYKFMMTEEVNQAVAEAEKRAEEMLQIPPIVKQREDIDENLSHDPALQGHDGAKFVFTDISYGVSNKDRLMVVRETDGTLRKAFWKERFRFNQIYFPMPGRQLKTPHMFEDEYLKKLLEKEEYEFILDRACVQFEPDDPKYHAVMSTVFSNVEKERKFEALASTRHFGALVFYLAWNKCIDRLLCHNIDENRLDDAVDIIRLYHILNPEAKSAGMKYDGQCIPFIQAYVEQDSSKKSVVELALQTHQELARQQHEVKEGIRRAHGHC